MTKEQIQTSLERIISMYEELLSSISLCKNVSEVEKIIYTDYRTMRQGICLTLFNHFGSWEAQELIGFLELSDKQYICAPLVECYHLMSEEPSEFEAAIHEVKHDSIHPRIKYLNKYLLKIKNS